MAKNIAAVKSSPYRAAYALDDEISWGHFVHPTMWYVTDDKAAYPAWLKEIYGPDAPRRERWVTYEDIRPKLASWSVKDFDASPLMDQWTFNDSYWNNFIGDLVEYSNRLDPAHALRLGGRPVAQCLRRLRLRQDHAQGAVPGSRTTSAVRRRSFVPSTRTTPSRRSRPISIAHSADTIWQTWYYLAHGNRGFIGWVEKWFDGTTPKPWHAEVAPHFREAGQKIGPLDERRRMAARRRGDLLQPCVDPARLDHGRGGPRQDLGQPQRRRPHRLRAPGPQGLGEHAPRLRLAVQLHQLRRRDPERRSGGIQGADPAGLPVPVGRRGRSASARSSRPAAR